jgi:hypothetical protein
MLIKGCLGSDVCIPQGLPRPKAFDILTLNRNFFSPVDCKLNVALKALEAAMNE